MQDPNQHQEQSGRARRAECPWDRRLEEYNEERYDRYDGIPFGRFVWTHMLLLWIKKVGHGRWQILQGTFGRP